MKAAFRLAASLALAVATVPAFAARVADPGAGMIEEIQDVRGSPSHASGAGSFAARPDEGNDPIPGGCDRNDLTCRARLERLLTGIRLATPQILGGFLWSEAGPGGALAFSLEGLGWDLPLGDLEALAFEMITVPGEDGFRVRFTTATTEAEYFCRSRNDEGRPVVRPPFAGISQECEPDQRWALGGTLLEYQKDTQPERWAMRWLQVQAVLNFLANGYTHDLLHRRLTGFAGLSLDSWGAPEGSTSAAVDGGTALRGSFGISGMLRTQNNRLEIRGLAAVRPNLIEWRDWAVESRFEAIYRFLFHPRLLAEAGLRADYSHWSMPERSIGTFASASDADTVFVGALFGIRWR